MPSPYRRSRAIARRGVLSVQRSAPGRAAYSSKAALVLPRRGFHPFNAYLPSRRQQVESELGVAESLTFFIGYPRSGHTALAAVINGHPEAVLAHELDLFKWLQLGVDKGHLLALIAERERWFEQRGRQWESYNYNVPLATYGGHPVKIVGDKMAGVSTQRLRNDPTLLQRARETFQIPLRAINVVRNPYDNIATISSKQAWSLSESIDLFAALSDGIETISAMLDNDELLTLRSEQLIDSPAQELRRVWAFLGLSTDSEYVERAPEFVMSKPSMSRQRIRWEPAHIEAVEALIDRYPHLTGYSFDADRT
jgi:hypothetical protein